MSMIARPWMLLPAALFGAAFFSLSALSHAQGDKKGAAPIPKPDYGVINLSTSIGSFKMLEYNDDKPPEGHIEMSFTGTVLVDTTEAVKNPRGLTTAIQTSGDVRLEVNYHGRKVYHGKGKIIVDGGWHALQWFGQDMKATFNGCGVLRLSGEFDKNLETGFYWYADGKKYDWGTGGNQPTVPQANYGTAKATVIVNGKKGN